VGIGGELYVEIDNVLVVLVAELVERAETKDINPIETSNPAEVIVM
jgi:hypothetical protein